jgi:hypothetical protein
MNQLTRFSTPFASLLAATALTLAGHAQSPADKPVVSGTFTGDGKDAGIKHLVVKSREAFSGDPAIKLIFTEKDPAASRNLDFDAGFKKLGSALILSVKKDGSIFGCEVAHTAHEKSPFTALGEIRMNDFKVIGTQVSGQLTTGKELEAFGQRWQVDLTFSAPLPKDAFAAAAEEPKPAPEKEADPATDAPPAAAEPGLPVAQLALPDGALDVQYASFTGHITFRSCSPVSTVAKSFAAKLKEQGWQDQPGSLTGKTNAILKQKRGAAELTIMVQPAAKGCSVKVFTQGLDWNNAPAAAPMKNDTQADAARLEAEANRRLEDALKQIPKF